MITRRSITLGALPLLMPSAQAQAWPTRPIRLVIPWPPGQATDQVGRLMAQRLSERLGQAIVPENRAGAGGSIGTDAVVKAAPDGYTLLAASIGPISLGPLVHRMPYDVERDLAPVARFSGSPYFLVVRPDFPPRDARAFVALMRANPGKYTYASSGVGGSQHVLTALFAAQAKFEALHVPYQGSGPAMAALLGGQVDFAIETLAACGALIREGKLKSYGCTTGRSSRLAPDIPPLAVAADIPAYDYNGWIGLMAPAGTPPAIITQIAAAVEHIAAQPETNERLVNIGTEAAFTGPAGFRQILAQYRDNFAPVIRQLGIRAE